MERPPGDPKSTCQRPHRSFACASSRHRIRSAPGAALGPIPTFPAFSRVQGFVCLSIPQSTLLCQKSSFWSPWIFLLNDEAYLRAGSSRTCWSFAGRFLSTSTFGRGESSSSLPRSSVAHSIDSCTCPATGTESDFIRPLRRSSILSLPRFFAGDSAIGDFLYQHVKPETSYLSRLSGEPIAACIRSLARGQESRLAARWRCGVQCT